MRKHAFLIAITLLAASSNAKAEAKSWDTITVGCFFFEKEGDTDPLDSDILTFQIFDELVTDDTLNDKNFRLFDPENVIQKNELNIVSWNETVDKTSLLFFKNREMEKFQKPTLALMRENNSKDPSYFTVYIPKIDQSIDESTARFGPCTLALSARGQAKKIWDVLSTHPTVNK